MIQATSAQNSTTLTASDFTPGAQLVNIMSPVAYFDVPVGHIIGLLGKKSFRAYIKGRKDLAGVTGETFDTNVRATRTQRPAGAFPTANHPDLVVWGRDVNSNGPWTKLEISWFDFSTGELVLQNALTEPTDLRVYYVISEGEFEIRAARPVGSDGVTTKLFGAPFRAMHEVDQTNARSAPTFGGKAIFSLPQNYRLTLEARTGALIDWSDMAEHELVISAVDQPVRVTDEQLLMVRAEEKLRGGF